MDNKFKLGAKLNKLLQTNSNLPIQVGVIAKGFFEDNFTRQGFLDSNVQRWSPRKKADQGRAILVKSGDLRKSIKVTRKSKGVVSIGSDLRYAPVHNYGTAKMPKREFIGDSVVLKKKLRAKIILEINKAIK